jgi:SAM-dependent methyltransferase
VAEPGLQVGIDLDQTIILAKPSLLLVYAGQVPDEQLIRQLAWLGDSWTWLLRTMVLEERSEGEEKPTALDVGCGPGLVMERLSPHLDVRGVDIDPQAVLDSNARGQKASVARAERLPFEDGSFDIVYCSFLLLWVDDPLQVIREMTRVSRDWVICLAEPDHLGRISHPPGVAALDGLFVNAIREQGADPGMGRRLQETFVRGGLRPVTGVHANMWSAQQLQEEAKEEWRSLTHSVDQAGLPDVRRAWDEALADGSLVQYNPVFFALARKRGQARQE